MPYASHSLLRGLTGTWLVIGILLLALTWWAGQRTWPTDAHLYDRLLTTRGQPPADDILIAAIDERSLEALGQWPWPRHVHASLLDRLTDTGVQAVLLDVVFAEPARDPDEDRRLAQALERHGHVFLPVIHAATNDQASDLRRLSPIEPLRSAARGTGHIDIRPDADGVVRRIRLREDHLPQLALSTYQDLVTGTRVRPHATTRRLLDDEGGSLEVRIPYLGSTFHYPTVSYVDLLEGRLPRSLLEDRILLVGATARGLGDRHPTPFGGGQGGMPGIEIQAHLLDGLLQGRLIREVPDKAASALSLLPLLIFMALVRGLKFRHMAKLTLGVLVAVLLSSWGLLTLGWWWPPTVGLGSVLVASVLISWRCQATAMHWFQRELGRLEDEPSVVPEPPHPSPQAWGFTLHQRLHSLESAITRIRNTRRFITDSMDSLPIATLVTDRQGNVIISSDQAKQLFAHYGVDGDDSLHALLSSMTPEGQAMDSGRKSTQESRLENGECEALDDTLYEGRDERHFHIKVSPLITDVDAFEVGWLISLVDVTSERQAAEQRTSLLRFLSHDLKAPQSNILALTQLQHTASRLPEEQLLGKIAQQARNSLTLTDDFMKLTRAEFGALEKGFVLLADVILEAIDQAWPLARQRNIRVECDDVEDACPMEGDRAYLLRAIFNLLDNAIKYSPPDTRVLVSAKEAGDDIFLSVRDQGVGIPERDLPYIFDSYQRSSGSGHSAGYGLGLSLVQSVIERHGGTIECQSTEHVGTGFYITLPALGKDNDADASGMEGEA